MLYLHPRRIRQLIIKHMYKRAIKILIKDLSYNREDKKNFNIIFFLIKDVEYHNGWWALQKLYRNK